MNSPAVLSPPEDAAVSGIHSSYNITGSPTFLSRAVTALYLLTIALLPWSWFPPFPWLHEHAQWSDAVFALTAAVWAIELWRGKRRPRLHAAHAAILLYFLCAALSLLMAEPREASNVWKLLGVAELCVVALITSDIAGRRDQRRAIARVVAVNSLVICAAALAGLILFYAGVSTRLVGSYGDLNSSELYARVQAGFYHPNLLASYSIFAATIVSRDESELPGWLCRAARAALWLTVALTFSRAILGFSLAAILRRAKTRPRRIFAAVSAAAFAGVIFFLTLFNLSLDPTHPENTRLDYDTPSSRYQAISTSLDTLAAKPMWGSGLGNSPGRYRGLPFDAHMTPVNIAATLGLPALVAFTGLVVILWRRRRRPTDLPLWGGLAGLALDALAQDVEDFRHVWVMIGLACANSNDPAQDEQLP